MNLNQSDMSGDEIIFFNLKKVEMFYVKSTNQFFRKHIYKNRPSIFKEQLFYDNGNSYQICTINKKRFLKHRMVYYVYNQEWDIMDGSIATNIIDHIDCNPLNNDISNLRKVTNQQNQFNRTNTKGYYWCKKAKKWRAQIVIDGKQQYLGCYQTEKEARQVYLAVKKINHRIP